MLGLHKDIAQPLLEAGADLDAGDSTGDPVLVKVADRGHLDLVGILIEAGADVNARGPDNEVALVKAVQRGHVEIVQTLVRAGAALTTMGPQDQSTALQIAARHGREDLVRVLIEAGADVNYRRYDRWSPLMEAAFRGRGELASLLLSAGADVNASHPWRGDALCIAAREGYQEIVRLLLNHLPDQLEKRKGYLAEALHTAAYFDQVLVMKLLIDAGADVDVKVRLRWAMPHQPPRSVLYEAVRKRHLLMVRLLLWARAEFDIDEVRLALASRPFPSSPEHAEVEYRILPVLNSLQLAGREDENNLLNELD